MEFTLKEEIIDKQNLIIASIGIIQVVVKNIIRCSKITIKSARKYFRAESLLYLCSHKIDTGREAQFNYFT